MKSQTTLLQVACAALLASSAGFAAAADSTTLAVTATVTSLCKFSATSTSLAFGGVYPQLTVDKVVTANVLYKCTKGTASAGVTATGGTARTMTGPAASTMGYTLVFTGGTQTGTGFGTGQDLILVATGTITAAQYQNATAGAYSENVTLNITP